MPLTRPLSMQLYSARKFPPVEAQLATIKANGYDNVETFGPFHEDPAATRRLLDAHGLTAKSAHIGLDMIDAKPERVAEIALELGVEIIVAPFLPPTQRPATVTGWMALGARLDRHSERFADRGLRFAWHNHDFEFQALDDGSMPINHVLGNSLLWEADLAWVAQGKADPEFWIEHYRGRIPLVHVKDIAPAGENAGEDGWADIGAGVMPWSELWTQCVAGGAEIMVAEHDNPSNFDRFARVSAESMRGFMQGASS